MGAISRGLSDLDEGAHLKDGRTQGVGGQVGLEHLFIRTKRKQLVPFTSNQVQQSYLDDILPSWRDGDISPVKLREILLKARQQGFSTLIAALFFCDTINTPNTTTVVLANETIKSETLFQMVRLMHEQLPADLKRRTKYSSKRELYFEEINSRYYVGAAGSVSFGRGDTINNLHASEAAFFPDNSAEDLATGVLQAVPEDGNVFLESTANGVGNFYHQEYEKAESGDSEYTSRFSPWFRNPEYSRPVPADWSPDKSLRLLMETHGLSLEQAYWYYRKGREPGMRKKLRQEYPSTPREAFIASGTPFFDNDLLDRMDMILSAPAHQPMTVLFGRAQPKLRQAYRSKLDTGRREVRELQIYEAPVPGRLYVIGADVAEGLDGDGNHDYSEADVIDYETGRQVAHFRGQWSTHDFALLLNELGRWYSFALLGVERNNHGHAVLNTLIHELEYPPMDEGNPHGVYMHQEYDQAGFVEGKRPGWPTTQKSRGIMLSDLDEALSSGDLKLRCRDSIAQLMTFVKKKGGKSGGSGSCHDDAVISLAVANQMLKLAPKESPAFALKLY